MKPRIVVKIVCRDDEQVAARRRAEKGEGAAPTPTNSQAQQEYFQGAHGSGLAGIEVSIKARPPLLLGKAGLTLGLRPRMRFNQS